MAPSEVHRLSPRLAICQRYDRAVKADVSCTALEASDGIHLIDPFLMEPEALASLLGNRPMASIIVTNSNHARASLDYSHQLAVPIHAAAEAGIPNAIAFSGGDQSGGELEVLPLPGAPAGEIAIYSADDGGTMIMGDALINFGAEGFALLPTRYCENAKRMRESIRLLRDRSFVRMLFAHGAPITVKARERLAALLDSRS